MQDEKAFLSGYSLEDYPRPSVTADIVAFRIRESDSGNYRRNSQTALSVLLIKRGGHPYKGCWALPGGFLSPGETIEQCAFREVEEETAVKPASLMPVGVFSEPGRDPRGWIISNAFACIISDPAVRAQSGDDAADAKWFDVDFAQDENGDSDPDGNFIADFTVVVNCTITKPAHQTEIHNALSAAKIQL